MPIAHYSISHRATRRVLAFVSLEKTTPSDADAWKAFRTKLIGETDLELPTFAPHKPLKFPVDDLAVDEVDIDEATARRLYTNPYLFEIVVTGTAEPGDGTLKKLSTPGNTAKPTITAANTLRVELTNTPPAQSPICVLFEGEPPQIVPITLPNLFVDFALATTTASGDPYFLVVLASGAPVFSGVLKR
jgi:hypothetical protein